MKAIKITVVLSFPLSLFGLQTPSYLKILKISKLSVLKMWVISMKQLPC